MTICQLWGVRLKINWLFFVVIILFALVGELARALTAFSVVFVHELGHVWIACKHGLQIEQIELLPFGGVAVFKDNLELDHQIEKAVALAGPMVNFVLVLVTTLLTRYGYLNIDIAVFFISYNLGIGLFNLIPALPLDGGRILRALLVPVFGYWKATHQVLQLTRVLALIVGGWAFFMWIVKDCGLFSLLGAFFVYFATLKEGETSVFVLLKYLGRKKARIQELKTVPIEQHLVMADTKITQLLKLVSPSAFTRFLLYDKEYNYLGILTEVDIIDAFFKEGKNIPILELLTPK